MSENLPSHGAASESGCGAAELDNTTTAGDAAPGSVRRLAEGDEVLTPAGPGTAFTVDDSGDGVALVRTDSGLRALAFRDLTYPDGSPVLTPVQQQDRAAHRTRLTQAQTAAGIELRHGLRLVDLDLIAGHGWIVDSTGAAVAFVRARLGDDGLRHWWLQRLDGGQPLDASFPERLHSPQGHAALRAAKRVVWYLRPRSTKPAGPIPGHLASQEVTLTLARVRELHTLPLPISPFTGETVSAPEWNLRWRCYTLTVDQMVVLAAAARTALAAITSADTAEARRRARVLTAAADQLELLAFDTARRHATIPAPGQRDPYAAPYAGPPAHPPIVDLDGIPWRPLARSGDNVDTGELAG